MPNIKTITPIVSVILLIMLTIVASVGAYFFITTSVNDLQSSGAIEGSPYLDNSRLNLVSITGSQALVRNDGNSPVTEMIVLINGETLNYTLDTPIMPGEIREINYTSQLAGEDLEIKVIYNKGKTEEEKSPASQNTINSGFSQTQETCSGLSDIEIIYSRSQNYFDTYELTSASYGDNIYLSWSDLNSSSMSIFLLKSVDSGNTWDAPKIIFNTNPTGSNLYPKMYAYENNLHIIYSNTHYGAGGNPILVYANSTDYGLTWNAEFKLNETIDEYSYAGDIESYDGTTLHAFFDTNREKFCYKKSDNAGASWSNTNYLFNSSDFLNYFVYFDSMVINSSDIYVIFENASSSYSEIYFIHSEDEGDTWTEPVVLLSEDEYSETWGFIEILNNTLYIVYSDENSSTGDYELYYITSSDKGANWSEQIFLKGEAGYQYFSSSLKEYGGKLYLTYYSMYDEYYHSKAYYSVYSGNNWGERIQLSNDSETYSIPSEIIALNNEIHFIWSYFDSDEYNDYYIAHRKLCLE